MVILMNSWIDIYGSGHETVAVLLPGFQDSRSFVTWPIFSHILLEDNLDEFIM